MEELINKILGVLKENRACVCATVVASAGSAPRGIGAKMVVFSDGSISGSIGGGGLEKLVVADALVALKRRKSLLKSYSLRKKDGLQICGGRVSIFLEVVEPDQTLVICGAGHIGLALSLIVKLLGWRVVVIDNRRAFADRARLPHVDQIVCDVYVRALGKLPIDKKTHIVIVTHGHAFDAECLEASLKTSAGYIGMIGSRTKIQAVFDHLKRKGIAATRLKKVHTPVGLAIGAQSPEEIAVAIAAELVREMKKEKLGRWLEE